MEIQNEHELINNQLVSFARLIAQFVVSFSNKENLSIAPENKQHTPSKQECEDLLSVKEVCKILGVSRGTVYNLRKLNLLLPDVKIGRSPRYKKSTLVKFTKGEVKL